MQGSTHRLFLASATAQGSRTAWQVSRAVRRRPSLRGPLVAFIAADKPGRCHMLSAWPQPDITCCCLYAGPLSLTCCRQGSRKAWQMPGALCSASSQHDFALLPAGSPSRGSTQARRRLQVALQRLAERNQWPAEGDSDDPLSPTSEWGFPVTRWGRCCLDRQRLAHIQKLPDGSRGCQWHRY